MCVNRFLAIAAALFIAVLPVRADQQLGPGRILGSDPANGDIVFGNLKIGRMLGGKKVLQPDAVQIQGSGSTGDMSTVSSAVVGGILRQLADRYLDRLNVLDFPGATSAIAINAAINAAAARGGAIVEVPNRGTPYVVSQSIILKAGVELRGLGRPEIQLAAGANVPVLQTENFATLQPAGGTGVPGVSEPHRFAIRNINFNGNRTNQTVPANGVNIWGYDFVIQDVNVFDAKGTGFYSGSAGNENNFPNGNGSITAHIDNLQVQSSDGDYNIDWNGPHDSVMGKIIANRGIGKANFHTGPLGGALQIAHLHTWSDAYRQVQTDWILEGNISVAYGQPEGGQQLAAWLLSSYNDIKGLVWNNTAPTNDNTTTGFKIGAQANELYPGSLPVYSGENRIDVVTRDLGGYIVNYAQSNGWNNIRTRGYGNTNITHARPTTGAVPSSDNVEIIIDKVDGIRASFQQYALSFNAPLVGSAGGYFVGSKWVVDDLGNGLFSGLATGVFETGGGVTAGSTTGSIFVYAAGGAAAVPLPAADASMRGRILTIKKTDPSANPVTLQPSGSDKIDGLSSYAITKTMGVVRIQCGEPGHWWILGTY